MAGPSSKKRHREKAENPELIWGIHPVMETLKSSPRAIREILVDRSRPDPKVEEIVRLAEKNGVSLSYTSLEKHGISDEMRHQGVAALIASFSTISLDELLIKARAVSGAPLLLALDGIQDPHNLGAIIRTALAAGVQGLIITKDRAAPLSGTAAKSSAGAIAILPICRVTNLVAALKKIKENGLWIFGTAMDGAQPIYQTDFSLPLCMVIGGEGKGLRPLVRENCDFLVSIPMQGDFNSLNASVAAGVVLFEVVRQRSNS